MTKHRQPTTEELTPNIDELEKLEKEHGEEKGNIPVTKEEVEQTEVTEDEEEKETEREEKDAKEEKKKQEEPDYKKKYVESSREAQVLHAKTKKTQEAISKAAEIEEPTEEELRAEYTDWDKLSDTQRRLAKETMLSSRRFAVLNEANKEFRNLDEWNKKVDTFLDDPKNLIDFPELEGKQEDFKVFVTSRPSRRGLDFSDLVGAFVFNATKTAKPKHKGKMFEAGTGGPSEPSKKKDKLTIEEGAAIKKSNYEEYKRLLVAGKIESEF